MGFGLLFIGYFMTVMMSLNVLGGLFACAGYIMIIFASRKLSQYDGSFKLLLASSAVMTAICSLVAFCEVSSLLYRYLLIPSPIVSEEVYNVLLIIRVILELFFVAIMCFCIRSIAKETGANKIMYAAVRNFIFFFISFTSHLFS